MFFSLLLAIGAMHSVLAAAPATPAEAISGDWDMGPNSTALRIEPKDAQSVFVQYCDRDLLLNQHVCDASVILYFTFSPSTSAFVHQDSGAQPMTATLQISPQDATALLYTFKSASGAGTVTGKKIINSSVAP